MSNLSNHPDDSEDPSPSSPSAYAHGATFVGGPRDAAPSRSSRYSEGYPSWLPRRPPPPAPASTVGTSTPAPFDPDYFANNDEDVDMDLDAELRHLDAQYDAAASPYPEGEEDESPVAPNPLLLGGRKATPRSVRIVNLESPGITEEPRAPAAAAVAQPSGTRPSYATSYAHWNTRAKRQNRVSSGSTAVAHPSSAMVAGAPRGWSRANAPPTMFNSVASSYFPAGTDPLEVRPRPRFNTRGLHLELVRSPSRWMKVYYRLWPILVLAHLPLQTFLDFNTAYMLIQVSKHPLPGAGSSSGKNWALGTAAYIACWLVWVLVIFIIYELVYSFARRWRVRRPLIFPIYLSNAAYTYACMTSFNTFCFLQHLRWTAFVPISPELEGITSSSSSGSSPRSSGEAHEHEREHQQEMIERGQQPRETRHHGRTDSTSSSGSAQEDDPALGRRQSPAPAPGLFRKLTFASNRPRQRTSVARNSMDIPRSKPTHALRKKLKRTKRFWSQVTWRDGLAETFNLYAQNVPSVVVLLPRAGLALALVLGFAPGIGWSAGGASLGPVAGRRDSTFFRESDGLLTRYALGILWANVGWAAWRVFVLVVSWIGMWILSGHTCAGICGPRDKWEEEELDRLSASLSRSRRQGYTFSQDDKPHDTLTEANTQANAQDDTNGNDGGQFPRTGHSSKHYGGGKEHRRLASWYSNSSSVDDDDDILPWEWRECTRARVQDAWEFCIVGDGGRLRWGAAAAAATTNVPPLEKTTMAQRSVNVQQQRPRTPEKAGQGEEDDGTGLDDAGLQRVLAAVGFPTPGVPTPARRGALRSDLFESPTKARSPSPAGMLGAGPAEGAEGSGDLEGERKTSLPLLKLPYPFSKPGSGYVSSREGGEEGLLVPFPAKDKKKKGSSKAGSSTGKKSPSRSGKSGSGSGSSEGDVQERHEGDDDDDEEDEDGEGHVEGRQRDGTPSSSSHNYSSESSTISSPSSSSAPSLHSRAAGAGSQSNSLSSLGQPIPPTSPAFISRGYPHPRQLTQSGGTLSTHNRHSSMGSAASSPSAAGNVSGVSSSGFSGGPSSGGNLTSPRMSMSERAGTRFPFLSGPPALSSAPGSPSSAVGPGASAVGPSTHYGVHGRRVVTHHTGGTTTTSYSYSAASGSGHGHGHGHSRGLSHASAFSGLGSDVGYAASGSGEGMDMELEEERSEGGKEGSAGRGRASLSQSSGGSGQSAAAGVVAGGVIPMPPRHPHAGRSRVAPGQSSSSGGSRSGSARNSPRQPTTEGIAFPTGSDADVNTTVELGMVTGYGKGMGMEMLSIEASDSLARRERAERRGLSQMYNDDDDDENDEKTQERIAQGTASRDSVQAQNEEAPARDEDNDHDDMYVQEDEEEEDEEARGEREDRVGLLTLSLSPSATSLHRSPRTSLVGVDQLGQLLPLPAALVGSSSDLSSSRRSSRRNSATTRRSRESLGVSPAQSRSRHSSHVRSNRPSLVGSPTSPTGTVRRDSLLGAAGAAVRDRASSFGSRVRERAQSLMQSVVGGGSSAQERRERTTSEVGLGLGHAAGRHRRLGSAESSVLSSAVPPVPPLPVASPTQRSVSGESSESNSDKSRRSGRAYGHLGHLRMAEEEEAYSSSSHSRSGSGSVASHGENYTFGRPIPFLASQEEQEREEEEVPPVPEIYRVQEPAPPLPRVRTTSMAMSASSMGEEIFYSPASGATPLQSGLTTPVPTTRVPAIFETGPQEQEEGSPDLPWTQRLLQSPEQRWVGRDRSLASSGDGSGSGSGEMMLSSAAQSFVTAPASLDTQSMFTITTRGGGDSSEAATITGSWEDRRGSGFVGAFLSGTSAAAQATVGRGGRRGRDSGFVERVGEGGAAGGLGDGRVA